MLELPSISATESVRCSLWILSLLANLAINISTVSSAFAQNAQMKIGHVVPAAAPRGRAADWIAGQISADPRCQIDAKVFPSSQLGGDTDLIEGLQINSIEMVVLPGSFLVGFQPLIGILDFPFFFPPDWEDLRQIHASDAMREVLATTEEKGIVSLGIWHTGFKVWTSNERPLSEFNNFAGLKARVMPSQILKEQSLGFGLTAVGMPFSETYSALQIGAIDAQDNPITTTFFMKFHEVQEFLALTNHGTLDQVVMVSKLWWDTIDSPCREAIREAVSGGGDLTAELTYSVINSLALPAFAASGLTVSDVSEEERALMQSRVLPGIERRFLEETGDRGAEILDAFKAEIAKYVD